MEENNAGLENVIGNELIGDKIVSFLSFEDMKMASMACRGLHGMVRRSQRFPEITALRLTSNRKIGGHQYAYEEGSDKNLEHLQLSSGSWGMVEFDTKLSTEILRFLQSNKDILGNIKTLRLTRNSVFDTRAEEKDRETLLRMILDNCGKVEELQIDLGHLVNQDFRQLLHPGFFEAIKSVEFFSSPNHRGYSEIKPYTLAFKNLKHFSTCGMKLEHIKIAEHYEDLNIGIGNMISCNRETLQSIDFHAFNSCDHGVMENIEIPNLKQVNIRTVVGKVLEGFVKFLENQPPLEHLTALLGEEDSTVFWGYLEKKATSLLSLNLAADFYGTPINSIHWQFLANCSNLHEFTVLQTGPIRNNGNVDGIAVLTWLPSSVRKLSIGGLKSFWKAHNNGLRLATIANLLSRFNGMTKLELTQCDGTVSDLVVQTIIAQMPKLRELKFSHGSFTDFGLTGIQNGVVVGVSLIALTGLTHLSIKSCPGISTPALVISVKHSFLQSFEYRSSMVTKATTDQVKQLVYHNPSLRSLIMDVAGMNYWVKFLETKLRKARNWKTLSLVGSYI